MLLAYWFMLLAALMPYSVVQIARGSNFNNAKPRDNYANAEGRQKRAYNAHLNSFEAFPIFAAAVLVAVQGGAASWVLNLLAGGWLLVRCGYIYAYLKDMPRERSALWTLAMILNVAMFTLPLWGPRASFY